MLFLLLSLVLPLMVFGQPGLEDIRQSHIEANVPAPADFSRILKRDLLGYFQQAGIQAATRVEYRLLRDVPTQYGVALPKYYAWVQVYRGPLLVTEGATRLAAMERSRFEVIQFLSKADIEDNPQIVATIFPAPLVPLILNLAGADAGT